LLSRYLTKPEKYNFDSPELGDGSIIKKFKKLTSKIINVEYNYSNCKYWNNINLHRKVRNSIIHNGGVLKYSKDSEYIMNIANSGNSPLKLINNTRLLITKEYIEEVIVDYQNWFQKFIKHIREKS